MVDLTFVTKTIEETVYFDEPILKVDFMKLISCSLYNSWHTLKNEGSAALGDEKKGSTYVYSQITPRALQTLQKK